VIPPQEKDNQILEVFSMEGTELLLAANAVVWLGVCGYIAFLAAQTRRLRLRLHQLELKEEGDGSGDG